MSKAPYTLFAMCEKTFKLSNTMFLTDRTNKSTVPDDIDGLKIFDACVLTTKFFRELEFVKLSEGVTFTWTKLKREEIMNQISDEIVERVTKRRPVTLKRWRPPNPFTSAIAMVKRGEPCVIYINARKIAKRDEADYINTLVHEFMHVVGFSHGSNSPRGKEDSVPYRMGQIAEDWARKEFGI
jgi:hypothetical protein